jgi:beta-lactamase regulating signal transducer with metallopeptidase domain
MMAQHLWQTTVVLLIIWLISLAMRRAPARFLNSLLWIGFVKLLVPFAALEALGRSLIRLAPGPAETLGISLTLPSTLTEGVSAVLSAEAVVNRASDGLSLESAVPFLLTAFWVGGVVALTYLGRASRWRTGRDHLTGVDAAPAGVRERVTAAAAAAGVPADRIRVTSSSLTPHVSGIVLPRIVLPEAVVMSLEDQELQGILIHEDAHRRRWEPARVALARLAALLFFFYPPMWVLLRLLRDTGEMACDDAALECGIEPAVYAGALARTVELGLGLAPSGAALDRRSPSLIRRRLKRLSQPWRLRMLMKHRAVLALTVLVVILLSALSAMSGSEEATREKVEKPAETKVKLIKMTPPEYPEIAREKGLEAVVLVEITVGDDLKVTDAAVKTVVVSEELIDMVKFKKDSKAELYPPDNEEYAEFHVVFGEAAVEAAVQWEIAVEPEGAELPSPVLMIPVQFKLDGDKEAEAKAEVREKIRKKVEEKAETKEKIREKVEEEAEAKEKARKKVEEKAETGGS